MSAIELKEALLGDEKDASIVFENGETKQSKYRLKSYTVPYSNVKLSQVRKNVLALCHFLFPCIVSGSQLSCMSFSLIFDFLPLF